MRTHTPRRPSKATRLVLALAAFVAAAGPVAAQVGGNIGYSQGGGKSRADQRERTLRGMNENEIPPAGASFVDARVLINVKADSHVAVFGISQEGATLAECSAKMEAVVKAFAAELKIIGIDKDGFFVDFVAQNKIYGYQVAGDIIQEKLVGFDLKKNVTIPYKDAAMIEKITLAAARAQVYDLIKVDYIVKDLPGIQDQLMEEAARIIKRKINRYERLLGVKLQPPAQIYAEREAIHFPTQMYDSYSAYESEDIRSVPKGSKYTVQNARKTRTFFFNALDADGFDVVVNPVITEPVVQFTLYLKLKYQIEPVKAK